MAAPETHIVLGKEFLKLHPDKFDEKEFIVGTSFPDIRYLGVIDRDKTHFKNVTLEQVLSKDSFMAGVLLHSFVDEQRVKYVEGKRLYKYLPPNRFMTQSDKFYEDMQLYSLISDWEAIASYFKDILEGERSFGLEDADIQKWHDLLIEYITQTPTLSASQTFARGLKGGEEMSQELAQNIKAIENSPEASQIIKDFHNYFIDIIR